MGLGDEVYELENNPQNEHCYQLWEDSLREEEGGNMQDGMPLEEN